MNKNFLTNSLKTLSALASIISIQSYIKSIIDQTLQEKLNNSENLIKVLEGKLNNYKLDDISNELIKNKIEILKINLNECNQNATKEIELLKTLENNQNNNIEYHINNYLKAKNKAQILIEEFLVGFNDKNNFIGDNNFFENIKIFIEKLNEIIPQLNIEQLGALSHLSASIFMLLCLLSIISIIYSDYLLNYFKIEEKYPKLNKLFKIRKVFQYYYLFLNLCLIFITLIVLIYINFKILIITTF
uniref:hypothetical protein n=1 Tax=Amanita sinensis TaxID=67728 RepID=UPI001D104C6C|nr:hypothetical protein LK379_mgp15 [Amanita sinensis]QZN08174.1 hypothetical protein [Amanita sinensis]